MCVNKNDVIINYILQTHNLIDKIIKDDLVKI